MDLRATILLTSVAAAAIAASLAGLWWRKRHPLGRVAMMPWTGLLFVALAAFAVGAAHLATLLGHPLARRY